MATAATAAKTGVERDSSKDSASLCRVICPLYFFLFFLTGFAPLPGVAGLALDSFCSGRLSDYAPFPVLARSARRLRRAVFLFLFRFLPFQLHSPPLHYQIS